MSESLAARLYGHVLDADLREMAQYFLDEALDELRATGHRIAELTDEQVRAEVVSQFRLWERLHVTGARREDYDHERLRRLVEDNVVHACDSCSEFYSGTMQFEYIGLTMSMAPDCTRCGKLYAGRFSYLLTPEVQR